MYDECNLCAFRCGIDRNISRGHCNAGVQPVIASYTLHYTEEPCISGSRGSGTVFFSNCSMKCVYCQNFPISQNGVGNIMTYRELANAFIDLQKRGAHNINLVTPTHYIPSIYKAIKDAKNRGMTIPVVYNTSSYENNDILEMVDEIADVFLADVRYASDESALKYSGAIDYVQTTRNNLSEFRRLKGDRYEGPIMIEGLIVRILLLPGMQTEAMDSIQFIANELGNSTVISIMSQYFPYHKAYKYPELNRTVNENEYNETVTYAEEMGFENIYTQYVNTEV